MAAFKRKCANAEIWINLRDHCPRHCHVHFKGKNAKATFDGEVFDSDPIKELPANVKKCIVDNREEMDKAWLSVFIIGKARC